MRRMRRRRGRYAAPAEKVDEEERGTRRRRRRGPGRRLGTASAFDGTTKKLTDDDHERFEAALDLQVAQEARVDACAATSRFP